MEKFTVGDILKATDGQLIIGDVSSPVKGFSTDSRTLENGGIFVALTGERFDGHDFVVDD